VGGEGSKNAGVVLQKGKKERKGKKTRRGGGKEISMRFRRKGGCRNQLSMGGKGEEEINEMQEKEEELWEPH